MAGFDLMDRRLLLLIIEKYGGGPVGVETLAAALSEEKDTIEDVCEPFLLQQGFLQRTPRGRVATAQAYRHFGIPEPAGPPGQGRLFGGGAVSPASLLLHVCCAPCAAYPVPALRAVVPRLAGFFFNPNIAPASEHGLRREALERYAPALGLDLVVVGAPPGGAAPAPPGRTRRGSERCRRCYELRLRATAREARRLGFAAFSTTLLYSIHQQHDLVRAVGEEVGARGGRRLPLPRPARGLAGGRAPLPRERALPPALLRLRGLRARARRAAAARRPRSRRRGRARPRAAVIDLHAHVLPGLDHGPGDWDEAVEMCRIAVADGISVLAATPHVSEEFPNRAREHRGRRRRTAQPALGRGGPPRDRRGRATTTSTPASRRTNVLTLGGNGRYFLLEFPYQALPPRADAFVRALLGRGLTPIVTHPERTASLQREWRRLEPLVREGALVQVTAGSLLGHFGPAAAAVAARLLREGWVHLLASDAHWARERAPRLAQGRDAAARLIGAAAADALVEAHPRAVLAGRGPRRAAVCGARCEILTANRREDDTWPDGLEHDQEAGRGGPGRGLFLARRRPRRRPRREASRSARSWSSPRCWCPSPTTTTSTSPADGEQEDWFTTVAPALRLELPVQRLRLDVRGRPRGAHLRQTRGGERHRLVRGRRGGRELPGRAGLQVERAPRRGVPHHVPGVRRRGDQHAEHPRGRPSATGCATRCASRRARGASSTITSAASTGSGWRPRCRGTCSGGSVPAPRRSSRGPSRTSTTTGTSRWTTGRPHVALGLAWEATSRSTALVKAGYEWKRYDAETRRSGPRTANTSSSPRAPATSSRAARGSSSASPAGRTSRTSPGTPTTSQTACSAGLRQRFTTKIDGRASLRYAVDEYPNAVAYDNPYDPVDVVESGERTDRTLEAEAALGFDATRWLTLRGRGDLGAAHLEFRDLRVRRHPALGERPGRVLAHAAAVVA